MIVKIFHTEYNGQIFSFTYRDLNEKIFILQRLGIPYDPTQDEQANEINIQTIRNGYPAFVAKMEEIQTTQNPTNAMVLGWVRDLARYLEITGKILRFFFEE